MKILAISGSPRTGNIEFILKTLLSEIDSHETELILLKDLKIENCTGCDVCFNEKKDCYIDDDMKQLYLKLVEADLIVFGSPNYFNNVSGLMKTFIDRTNSLLKPSKLKDKRTVIVCVGGQSLDDIKKCESALEEFIKIHKLGLVAKLILKADAPDEIKNNPEAITQLKEVGKRINELK
ncbi:flavodoxin family protein [Nanoarchaeota archaeon]